MFLFSQIVCNELEVRCFYIILPDKNGDIVSNSDRRHRDFSSGRWIPDR